MTLAGDGTSTTADVDARLLEHLFSTVARIRACELRIRAHIEEHGFAGFWHPGIGQEGVQAGAVAAMQSQDYLFYAHRGLGYVVARGMDLEKIFGDLLSRAGGSTGGKGAGTAHFADPALGILGQGGTLGSAFVVGAGAAISSQLLNDNRVALIFFGDGAASRGTFHEAAISSAAWRLPLVWICENNGWALSAPFAEHSPTPNVADRASAYGVPGVIVDGQDALAVFDVTRTALARARRGEGPTLIEAKTVRVRGHYEGDRQEYRGSASGAWQLERDPLELLRKRLPDAVARALEEQAQAEVRLAFDAALAQATPDPAVAFKDVWAQ